MTRPRYSEMLVERRRSLGLSVKQAAQVLKLKEQVLVAFEEGDFENIPKSGYAQGMLSSYARYLGLDPRVVVNQFTDDLWEYSHGNSPYEKRRRSRDSRPSNDTGGFEMPVRTRPGSRPSYLDGPQRLLPASQGPGGDVGRFSTTSQAHVRSESSNNGRPAGSSGSGGYYSSGSSPLVNARDVQGSFPQGRPYSGRDWSQEQGQSQGSRQRGRVSSGRSPRYESDDRARDGYRSRDDVTTRHVRQDQYVDDLRLDPNARPYQAASTTTGRAQSRNISTPERPNVNRRGSGRGSGSGRKNNRRGRTNQSRRRPGILGAIQWFLSDGKRIMFAIALLVAIILTVVIITSVGSCVSSQISSDRTVEVTQAETEQTTSDVQTTDTTGAQTHSQDEGEDSDSGESTSEDSSDTTTDAEGEGTEGEAGTTEPAPQIPTSYEVTVSVGDGEVSWVEIQNGSESVVAETITGPWSQTYTVTSTMIVQVGDTSAVTVTQDGENMRFDERASGVGTLTIEIPTSTDQTSD